MEDNAEQVLESLTDNNVWRRVSPIAILYFLSAILKQLVGQFYLLIPAALVLREKIAEDPQKWLSLVVSLFALLVVYSALRFYFFQFRLHQGSIEIRSGVLSKKHLNLPFERVQNVKLEQPIYYRFADYVCLVLDTAGSAEQEAKVVALPASLAESMKGEILKFQHKQQNQHKIDNNLESTDESSQANEIVLNTRSISDLVIHGLTSNRIWIILGAAAPFYDDLASTISERLGDIGIDLASYFDSQVQSWWLIGLYAISLTMIIMAFLALLSVLGAVVTFYGYKLTKLEDKYIRRSGLITRHEVSMRLSRLQMVVHKQDWLDRLLGRVNLKFEQVNNQFQNLDAGALSSRIIVPSVTAEQAHELTRDAYPDSQLATINFNPINQRFIYRYVGLFWAPIFLLLSAIFIFYEHYTQLVFLALGFLSCTGLVILRWYRWGYANDQHFIYVRKGLFGIDYFCFPIFKIQQTKRIQSVLMKKHQLCSIEFVLASGSASVPFLNESNADHLLDKALYQVESLAKPWM